MALIWAGETMQLGLADEIVHSVSRPNTSADLFETYLATAALLTETEVRNVAEQVPGGKLERKIDQELLKSILGDDKQADSSKAMAVRYLSDIDHGECINLLTRFIKSDDTTLASESIRTLGASHDESVATVLLSVAQDPDRPAALRCDAIMSYNPTHGHDLAKLVLLMDDQNAEVALAAARALKRHVHDRSVREAIARRLARCEADNVESRLADQLRFNLGQDVDSRPRDEQQWQSVLETEGDAKAGRRVFFDARVSCSKCHAVHGRGGRIGPNLTNISSSVGMKRVVQSILHPSRERSPDYQGYIVRLNNGKTFTGTQFHYRGDAAELLLASGEWIRFKLTEAEEYGPLDVSLMPEDLEKAISVSEFRDLLAYLRQLGGQCHRISAVH